MNLKDFNHTSEEEIRILLHSCVSIKSWSDAILTQRPFEKISDLVEYAKKEASTWSWEAIEFALNNHPRIGEKKAQVNLSDTEQTFSNNEQAAIKQSIEVQQALLEGNLAYEKKFGHIFLIRAMGLDSSDILQALKYRLLNDEETERRIVKQQLSEIAILRLTQQVS